MAKSIADLIMEYFKKHPDKDLHHGPVVDWVEKQYLKLYGRKPRDPWRQIRQFHQEGKLIKVRKGVYRYDPDYAKEVELFDFSSKTKESVGAGVDFLNRCPQHSTPFLFNYFPIQLFNHLTNSLR